MGETVMMQCPTNKPALATSIPAWMEKGPAWRFLYMAASFPRPMTVALAPPQAVPIKQEVATSVFPTVPRALTYTLCLGIV